MSGAFPDYPQRRGWGWALHRLDKRDVRGWGVDFGRVEFQREGRTSKVRYLQGVPKSISVSSFEVLCRRCHVFRNLPRFLENQRRRSASQNPPMSPNGKTRQGLGMKINFWPKLVGIEYGIGVIFVDASASRMVSSRF